MLFPNYNELIYKNAMKMLDISSGLKLKILS